MFFMLRLQYIGVCSQLWTNNFCQNFQGEETGDCNVEGVVQEAFYHLCFNKEDEGREKGCDKV